MKNVALVTGSSRGIGAAIAVRLSRAGWAVCVNYLEQKEKAEALVRMLRNENSVAMAWQADDAKAETPVLWPPHAKS